MLVKIYTGPPGCGKTFKTLKDMLVPGRYLYATSRIDLIKERQREFKSIIKYLAIKPTVIEIHSGNKQYEPIPKAIGNAISLYQNNPYVIVFVCHEGLMDAKLEHLAGWRVIIDEVPNATTSGIISASASVSFFENTYSLEDLPGTQMSLVSPGVNGASTKKVSRDDLASTLVSFDKKVKGNQGVFATMKSWKELDTTALQWVSIWGLGAIMTADAITLAGAGFEESLLLKATEFENSEIKYKKVDLSSSIRKNRKVHIKYFTSGHLGSTSFWKTSEGRFCLNKIAKYLESSGIHFWSGNEVVADHLEHRIPGLKVRPKQEGTNELSSLSTCAFIYSAKPLPADKPLMDLLKVSRDQILRARESEDIIQFAGRGCLRVPESTETYTIFLYSLDQAEMLAKYVTTNHLGEVEIIPVYEAGIMDFKRKTAGRKKSEKSREQVEDDKENRNKKDRERKRKKRAELKALASAASTIAFESRPSP